MPSLLATLHVKKDKIEEAKVFFKQLAATVKKNEPGTLAYVFHQKKDEPSAFVVYEKYASNEAFKTHGENLKSQGAAMMGLLDGRPELVFLDEI